ncbi:hypothetical protein H0H81_000714 [Sphagnurus paluster]|uniref:Uncharacterized protein n=1 Tax=Sphagnurus paluster TaxID=117069 RepID=A0A9P7FR97_9AGAR|nr:hypothetical protein H0H81_000714 [Sphagnurus paluster]
MMWTRPEPLLPTTVSLVLDYICPPSLLSPLPPHLISLALSQRHRFLHISTDDPAQYLAWPTESHPDTQQTAIHLLESLPKPVDGREYPVRYTSDEESAFAHVAISSLDPPGLRLVFQWSPSEGWQFHNLTLMPFPQDSYDSLNDAIIYEPHDFLDEPPLAAIDDDERDSYWDAYGLSDDDLDHPSSKNSKEAGEQETEDAYWAQYSAVHGSGDSTRPTPPSMNQKLAAEERVFIYPGPRTSSVYNPLQPPSPNTLACRLANLSPRAESPPFADESDSGSGSHSGSAASTSPTASPTSHASVLSSSTDFPSSLLSVDTHTPGSDAGSAISPPDHPHDDSREALKDTIRSVYRLWRAGKVISSPTTDDSEEFLEIVRQVIADSSLQ